VEHSNASKTLEESLSDESRINYHSSYLPYVLNAIRYTF